MPTLVLIGNSWRKDLFSPIDRNLTSLGSVATLTTPTKFDNLRVWRRISKPKITFNSTGMR